MNNSAGALRPPVQSSELCPGPCVSVSGAEGGARTMVHRRSTATRSHPAADLAGVGERSSSIRREATLGPREGVERLDAMPDHAFKPVHRLALLALHDLALGRHRLKPRRLQARRERGQAAPREAGEGGSPSRRRRDESHRRPPRFSHLTLPHSHSIQRHNLFPVDHGEGVFRGIPNADLFEVASASDISPLQSRTVFLIPKERVLPSTLIAKHAPKSC